jgi:hypothetical protein
MNNAKLVAVNSRGSIVGTKSNIIRLTCSKFNFTDPSPYCISQSIGVRFGSSKTAIAVGTYQRVVEMDKQFFRAADSHTVYCRCPLIY